MTLVNKASPDSRVRELYMQTAAQMSVEDVQQMRVYMAQNSGSKRGNSSKASPADISELASGDPCRDVRVDVNIDTSEKNSADNGADVSASADSKAVVRTRQKQSHDWPEIGTVLTAEYYGQRYRATVIKASKKLLSGKQVKLQNGPAAEEVCDSLSAAMLKATETQRLRMSLRRKGVANGWDFWQWEGK